MSRKAQVLDLQTARAAAVRTQRQIAGINDPNQGPKRRRYSPEVMNAFTMSAAMKLPPAVLSFIAKVCQRSLPPRPLRKFHYRLGTKLSGAEEFGATFLNLDDLGSELATNRRCDGRC